MVVEGVTGPSVHKCDGIGQIMEEGRGRGGSVGINRQYLKTWDIQKHIKYIRGTDCSVSMASVLGF